MQNFTISFESGHLLCFKVTLFWKVGGRGADGEEQTSFSEELENFGLHFLLYKLDLKKSNYSCETMTKVWV